MTATSKVNLTNSFQMSSTAKDLMSALQQVTSTVNSVFDIMNKIKEVDMYKNGMEYSKNNTITYSASIFDQAKISVNKSKNDINNMDFKIKDLYKLTNDNKNPVVSSTYTPNGGNNNTNSGTTQTNINAGEYFDRRGEEADKQNAANNPNFDELEYIENQIQQKRDENQNEEKVQTQQRKEIDKQNKTFTKVKEENKTSNQILTNNRNSAENGFNNANSHMSNANTFASNQNSLNNTTKGFATSAIASDTAAAGFYSNEYTESAGMAAAIMAGTSKMSAKMNDYKANRAGKDAANSAFASSQTAINSQVNYATPSIEVSRNQVDLTSGTEKKVDATAKSITKVYTESTQKTNKNNVEINELEAKRDEIKENQENQENSTENTQDNNTNETNENNESKETSNNPNAGANNTPQEKIDGRLTQGLSESEKRMLDRKVKAKNNAEFGQDRD